MGIPLRPDPQALNDNAVASLVRAVISTALGTLDKTAPVAEHARARWGDDRTLGLVLRAASSPTSLAGTPALAHVAYAFLEALVPQSAGAELLGSGIGLNFNGAASISVPGIALPVADFVAEGAPIRVVQAPTSPGATLTPFKIATIISLTGEMLRNANVETLVKQVLIEACGPALDKQLFSSTAAAADRPAGLLAGIAALTPAAAGEKLQVIVDDLQTLALAIAAVSGNGDIVLVASPDAAVALRLRLPQSIEWDVLTSAALPARTVIAVATNAVVSALEGAPVIDASQEAELHYEAATPGEIVNIGGVFSHPVGSLYQTDTVALRLKWPITWALRASNGLAWMTGCNW